LIVGFDGTDAITVETLKPATLGEAKAIDNEVSGTSFFIAESRTSGNLF
jgi:hypothetical protein